MDAQIDKKQRHLIELLNHTEKVLAGYLKLLGHAKAKTSDPEVLDRVASDAEAAGGAMGVTAARASELAGDLLEQ